MRRFLRKFLQVVLHLWRILSYAVVTTVSKHFREEESDFQDRDGDSTDSHIKLRKEE